MAKRGVLRPYLSILSMKASLRPVLHQCKPSMIGSSCVFRSGEVCISITQVSSWHTCCDLLNSETHELIFA